MFKSGTSERQNSGAKITLHPCRSYRRKSNREKSAFLLRRMLGGGESEAVQSPKRSEF